jgi:putative RecB family exonuclease
VARGEKTKSVSGSNPLERKQLEHLSYSALNTLNTCAKQFELTRLVNAPRIPAVWLAGGSAVHGCTEDFDRAQLEGRRFNPAASWQQRFGEQLDRLKSDNADISTWRQKETVAQWMVLGPRLCVAYFDWRKRTGWQLWVTPDGEPAIELDTSGVLPGCPMEIKQYVDRVFLLPSGMPFVVDIKTGTRQPSNGLQFGTYAAGIKAKYGVLVPQGAPFMNRKGALGTPFDLGKYSPEYMGRVFERARVQIEAGALNANPGSHCFFCDVSAACYARDGEFAATWDRDDPANQVPF